MNSHDHDPLDAEERELARQLRQLGPRGEPSAALDARILSAAHAELSARATMAAKRHRRWLPAMGLAASLVMAVGVVWQMRPTPPDTAEPSPSPAFDRSAPVTTEAVPAEAKQVTDGAAFDTAADAAADTVAVVAAPKSIAIAPKQASEAATLPSQVANEPSPATPTAKAYAPPPPPESPTVVMRAPAPEISAIAAPAPPAPPAAPAASRAVADIAAGSIAQGQMDKATPADPRDQTLDRYSTRNAARPASAAPVLAESRSRSSAAPADAAAAESLSVVTVGLSAQEKQIVEKDAQLSPRKWLQRVRERQRDGDEAGARASLQGFVQAHPRHHIPDDLRPLLQDR